jgi:hypothetical protein
VKLEFSMIFALGFAVAAAQTISTGSIEGEVVNIATGRAIPGAHVSAKGGSEPLAITADEKGRFRFAELPLRSYQVLATAPGLIPVKETAVGSYGGEFIRLSPTYAASNLRLEMRPAAAISGKVTDSAGAPRENANVEIMLRYPAGERHAGRGRSIEHGGYQYLGQRSVATNAAGEFHISLLPPGSYYLSVGNTFYPHSKVSDAKPVDLPEGKDLTGIDIQMPASGQ